MPDTHDITAARKYRTIYCKVPEATAEAAHERCAELRRETGKNVSVGGYVAGLIDRDVKAAQRRARRSNPTTTS